MSDDWWTEPANLDNCPIMVRSHEVLAQATAGYEQLRLRLCEDDDHRMTWTTSLTEIENVNADLYSLASNINSLNYGGPGKWLRQPQNSWNETIATNTIQSVAKTLIWVLYGYEAPSWIARGLMLDESSFKELNLQLAHQDLLQPVRALHRSILIILNLTRLAKGIARMTIGPPVALYYLKSIRIALDEATKEGFPLLDLDAEVRSRQVDDPMQLACITTWTRYGRMMMRPKKSDPCKDAQIQRPDADSRPSRADLYEGLIKGPPGTRKPGDSVTFPMRCTHEKSDYNEVCDRCRTNAHRHDQQIKESKEAQKRKREELCAKLNELVYEHADPVDGFEDIWRYLLSYTTLWENNLRSWRQAHLSVEMRAREESAT